MGGDVGGPAPAALKRRVLLALLAASGGGAQAHAAEDYPSRSVRMVVGFPAGGSVDIVARLVGQELSQALGEAFVVDNRSGASGGIGTDHVAKSAPDGYTLLMGSAVSLAANPSLYSSLPYDPARDFAPVSLVALQPNMLVVHPSLPVRSVAELIAHAKAHPGTLNYGSSGMGSTQHLSGEMFCRQTGVRMVHVPYRGGAPALSDLIAGRIQLMFETIPTALQAVRAGQLRPLAVTTLRRSASIPDLPTIAESGLPEFQSRGWIGLVAPAETPAAIVDLLNRRTVEILRKPEVTARLVDLGLEVVASSPAEFRDFIQAEIASIRAVVTAVGVTLD
ncbi:tripartite tricarboxylate transporter substrate binding protein [Arenibaculum sp.]|jgi:tripartite-type tricarboxylate transporter receptor subunit TctC|uniref:Bug family tripartite tricarboxylate transporter substrate binding protein n=1 Tax=Arenibaculum sp. TaxID=2865862 RepID=UPI002E117AE6|nr:tripartite tricarboxylate transporter substrate binding protein [Arenibaculum sp.]